MSSVLVEVGGVVDVVSVGLVTVAKEKTILKRRRKKVRNFGQFCLRKYLPKQSIFGPLHMYSHSSH
jgi:hypothetical protein